MYLCEGFLGAAVASATAFLFFARVRAVYENSKLVTITFGVFWLALTGASFVPSFSAKPVVSPAPRFHLALTGLVC